MIGEIARAIGPTTEADQAAVLIQTLVACGSAISRGPHARAEADRHGGNLFAVVVGATSRARKGTSWGRVLEIFQATGEPWALDCVQTGLSSGEGLIHMIRDPREHIVAKTTQLDPGVADKRALVVEPEFASTLAVLSRDGNTLSSVLRNAWDSRPLQIATKNSPARCLEPHVSLLGHITREELLRKFTETEAANGLGNRILWAFAQRSKTLPEGGGLDPDTVHRLGARLAHALQAARCIGQVQRNAEARALWHGVYPTLTEDRPGLLGKMIARAEAQVLRLSLIYAALDGSPVIRIEHLRAALAVWEYSRQSAVHIFGDRLGDPIADRILLALRAAGAEGLNRTAISKLFSHHGERSRIDAAFQVLLAGKLARSQRVASDGRPEEVWIATT